MLPGWGRVRSCPAGSYVYRAVSSSPFCHRGKAAVPVIAIMNRTAIGVGDAGKAAHRIITVRSAPALRVRHFDGSSQLVMFHRSGAVPVGKLHQFSPLVVAEKGFFPITVAHIDGSVVQVITDGGHSGFLIRDSDDVAVAVIGVCFFL